MAQITAPKNAVAPIMKVNEMPILRPVDPKTRLTFFQDRVGPFWTTNLEPFPKNLTGMENPEACLLPGAKKSYLVKGRVDGEDKILILPESIMMKIKALSQPSVETGVRKYIAVLKRKIVTVYSKLERIYYALPFTNRPENSRHQE